MTKVEGYRQTLREIDDWDEFLLRESALPGPRANLELAQAASMEGDESRFREWVSHTAAHAPTNTPQEFLAFCGVLGLGELLAAGRWDLFEELRRSAVDSRWRMREGAALALQKLGHRDMDRLIAEMRLWSRASLLEKRAAAAALCEPDLLREKRHAESVLHILDEITKSILELENRKDEDFRILRKGLGYCWSVAVTANPEEGKRLMEAWFESSDPDIRWIMRQNLKKKRLERMDAAWVFNWQSRLNG